MARKKLKTNIPESNEILVTNTLTNEKLKLFEQLPIMDSRNSHFPVYDSDDHKKLFEVTKEEIALNPDFHYHKFPDTTTTRENIVSSYYAMKDIGNALSQRCDNTKDSMMMERISNSGETGITSILCDDVSKLLFHAYKDALNRASDFMHTSSREYFISLAKRKANEMKYSDRDRSQFLQDSEAVFNGLIDNCTDEFSNKIKEVSDFIANDSYTVVPFAYCQMTSDIKYIPATIINLISSLFNSKISGYYKLEPTKFQGLEDILHLRVNIPTSLTQSLYNTIYFSIAKYWLDHETIMSLMTIMDAEGIFIEYHEKIVSIITYAFNKFQEFMDAGLLSEGEYNNDDDDEYEW